MQNPSSRSRTIIAFLAVALVIAVGAGLVWAATRNKPATATPTPTVSNGATPIPETDAKPSTDPNQLIFLGPGELITHGVTATQISDMKLGFRQYRSSQNLNFHQVRIDANSIHTIKNPNFDNDGISIIGFSGQFDDKTAYSARLNKIDLSTAQLQLFDPKTGAKIYDSGKIVSAPNQE